MKLSSVVTILLTLSISYFAAAVEPTAEQLSPGYLVLQSPALEDTSPKTNWWGQAGAQSFQLSGSFRNPRGTEQNYSEASTTVIPRLEIGLSHPWDETLTANVSLGVAYAKQDLAVQSVQGSLATELTSFIWSLRPSLVKGYGRWSYGATGELGEIYVVQSSSSLMAQEKRNVSFLGLGPTAEFALSRKTSLTALLLGRQTSKENSLRFSSMTLEMGVKAQW